MWLWRNPEIKKQGFIWAGLTAAAVLGAAFLYGGTAAVYVFVVCAAAGGLFWKGTKKRYEAISALSAQLNHLLHSPRPLQFVPDEEGELALLSSEIQKMTLRLTEQAEELKKEKRHLKESLADVSHQIRTPLTSIRMIVPRLYRKGLPDARRKEYVREISRLLNRMEWQVSVLLKIARLESGTVELKRDPVSVREVVDQAWEPLAIPAELKNIAIEINVEENSCFQGDLAWTVEALGNVLKNCVEHLPDGGRIEIRAARNPIYTGICIADNGAGIPEEELPHLFERFYRGAGAVADGETVSGAGAVADEESAPHDGSTFKRGVGENAGIGLALAQKIIHLQNGTIQARNRREGGAQFEIRFYRREM